MLVCIKDVCIKTSNVLKHEKCIQSNVSKYSQFWAKLFFQEGKPIRINSMPFSKRQKSNGKKDGL